MSTAGRHAEPALLRNSMKIVVAIKQVPARDSQLHIAVLGQLDRGRRSHVRDQRAGCLRAGRGPAAEREARRRSRGAVLRTRARRRRPFAKRWPRAPTAPSTSRRKIPGAYDPLAAARLMAAALKAEAPDLVLTGLQSRRSGLRTDRPDPGRAARPAARHHHHGSGEAATAESA